MSDFHNTFCIKGVQSFYYFGNRRNRNFPQKTAMVLLLRRGTSSVLAILLLKSSWAIKTVLLSGDQVRQRWKRANKARVPRQTVTWEECLVDCMEGIFICMWQNQFYFIKIFKISLAMDQRKQWKIRKPFSSDLIKLLPWSEKKISFQKWNKKFTCFTNEKFRSDYIQLGSGTQENSMSLMINALRCPILANQVSLTSQLYDVSPSTAGLSGQWCKKVSSNPQPHLWKACHY